MSGRLAKKIDFSHSRGSMASGLCAGQTYAGTHANAEPSPVFPIGSVNQSMIGAGNKGGILFVVYTERTAYTENDKKIDVTRLISARKATGFEKELYYGKYN